MDEDSTLLRLTGGDVNRANRFRGDDESTLLRLVGGDVNRDDRIRRGDGFLGVMYVFLIRSISFRRLLFFLPLLPLVVLDEDLFPCIVS